jgi:hypothetical protein
MTDPATAATQQLFDMWKKQLDEGTQAWSRLVGQAPPPPPDPLSFWKPAMEHALQTWARIFATTPVTPDLMTQWKQFLDQSIEAWSKALSEAMNTEAFAQMMGKTLDQWLTGQAPAKRASDQSIEATLQALNVPSRTQVAAVAKQIADLEVRLDGLDDTLAALARRLEVLLAPAREGPTPR